MSTNRLYENLDIVFKMVGNISPIGETNTDNERFENLKEMCDLTERLLSVLQMMRTEKDRYEYSIKRSGEYVDKFLTSIGLPDYKNLSTDELGLLNSTTIL